MNLHISHKAYLHQMNLSYFSLWIWKIIDLVLLLHAYWCQPDRNIFHFLFNKFASRRIVLSVAVDGYSPHTWLHFFGAFRFSIFFFSFLLYSSIDSPFFLFVSPSCPFSLFFHVPPGGSNSSDIGGGAAANRSKHFTTLAYTADGSCILAGTYCTFTNIHVHGRALQLLCFFIFYFEIIFGFWS